MNEIKIMILVVVVATIVYLVVRIDVRSLRGSDKKKPQGFDEEDIKALRRKKTLFDCYVPTGGHEWQTLSTDELLRVIMDSLDVCCRMHEQEKDFSRPRLLLEMETECRDLTQWAIDNANHPLFNPDDLGRIVEKAPVVAQLLRKEAFSLQPKP